MATRGIPSRSPSRSPFTSIVLQFTFRMPDAEPHKTLYLIDGHAQFFRAYHAIRSGMTSPVTKEPTNLTFGFVGMLLKVLRDMA